MKKFVKSTNNCYNLMDPVPERLFALKRVLRVKMQCIVKWLDFRDDFYFKVFFFFIVKWKLPTDRIVPRFPILLSNTLKYVFNWSQFLYFFFRRYFVRLLQFKWKIRVQCSPMNVVVYQLKTKWWTTIMSTWVFLIIVKLVLDTR